MISVIVPAHNSVKTMKRCAESLLAQDYPSFEVIVVDDGSTDGTPAVLEMFKDRPGFKTMRTQQGGPSRARNEALKLAAGEYVAFTDSDCIAEPQWLSRLAGKLEGDSSDFNKYSVMGVGGDQKSPEDESAFGKSVNSFLKKLGFVADYVKDIKGQAVVETDHNPTCNVLYKREVFDKVGVFDEKLWPGEDVDLDRRIKAAGYRLLYTPEAVVYHYRPADMNKYARMMYRYGKVQAVLVKRYGFFRKVQFVPFGLVLFALLYAAASFKGLLAVTGLAALQLAAFYAHFMLEEKDIKRAHENTMLLLVTVAAWNAGFGAGLFAKK